MIGKLCGTITDLVYSCDIPEEQFMDGYDEGLTLCVSYTGIGHCVLHDRNGSKLYSSDCNAFTYQQFRRTRWRQLQMLLYTQDVTEATVGSKAKLMMKSCESQPICVSTTEIWHLSFIK